ncbi:MAG: hypothetical protein ACK48K_10370, partial [Planctomycetota bacterium]
LTKPKDSTLLVAPSAFMSVHQRLNTALYSRRRHHLSGGVLCFNGVDKIDVIDGIDCGPC